MKAILSTYQKPSGMFEVRVLIPTWEFDSGFVVRNVSLHPHPCGTCVGGDHTHVEINDFRVPIKVLEEFDLLLPRDLQSRVENLIEAKIAIDAKTREITLAITSSRSAAGSGI